MAGSLQGKIKPVDLLFPVNVTSDAVTGEYVDYNGYNRALIKVTSGLVATGDSDDTVAFQVYRIDDIAAASAAASDHVAITAGTQTVGPSADTDTELGSEYIDLDFVTHSLDNGCLTITATGSEGCAAISSATILLYEPSGTHTDTSMTIVFPASS